MRIRLVLLVVLVSIAIDPLAARAHDPIIITDDQTTSSNSPFLPDGTVSFALYGSVARPGDTRVFSAGFVEGDRLHLSLLIPDLPPENQLSAEDLPYLTVLDPIGELTELRPDRRSTFAEPFSGTNYIELLDVVDVARQGVYTVTVVGSGPARFTVSIGDLETFGTPVEGVTDRSLGITGVMDWYASSPSTPLSTSSTTTTTSTHTSTAPSTTASSSPSSTEPMTTSGVDDRAPSRRTSSRLVLGIVAAVAIVGLALVGRRRGRSRPR